MRCARESRAVLVLAGLLLLAGCREPCPSEPAGLDQWLRGARGGCIETGHLCRDFTVDHLAARLSAADQRLLAAMSPEQSDLWNLFELVGRMRRGRGCPDPDWATQLRPVAGASQVLLRVGIGARGLLVGGAAGVLPAISRRGGEHDWAAFEERLTKAKQAFPEESQLFVFTDATVTVAELQRLLAISRGPGLLPRFEATIIACRQPLLSEIAIECEEWNLPPRPPAVRRKTSAWLTE